MHPVPGTTYTHTHTHEEELTMNKILRAMYDERRERVRAMFSELEPSERATVKTVMDVWMSERPGASSVDSTSAFLQAVEDVYAYAHEREEHRRAACSVWAPDEEV